MNIAEAIRYGKERLAAAGVADPLADTKYLLRAVLDREPTFLIAHPEFELSHEQSARFTERLAQRSEHMPIQYIIGKQEFFGLDFRVTPDVLIPRPETELLVEDAIKRLKNKVSPSICEVGTGSGCIAVSVCKNLPAAVVMALDISPAALSVARENARLHGVESQITFSESDIFSAVAGRKFDAVITNPPYVTADEFAELDRQVRDFEPQAAITDGFDGLTLIRRIVGGAPEILRPGGFLSIEVGYRQAASVKEMLEQTGKFEVEILRDLQAIERTVIGTRR